jgi:hypothetical protein
MPYGTGVLIFYYSYPFHVLESISIFTGAGSSNLPILTFPDFESLTCGSHHMQGPHVSDQKSGTAKSEDPIPYLRGVVRAVP